MQLIRLDLYKAAYVRYLVAFTFFKTNQFMGVDMLSAAQVYRLLYSYCVYKQFGKGSIITANNFKNIEIFILMDSLITVLIDFIGGGSKISIILTYRVDSKSIDGIHHAQGCFIWLSKSTIPYITKRF